MYEFHGWLGLAESTEESEISRLQPIIDELRTLLAGFVWPNVKVALLLLNGTYFLTITANVNRRRSEAAQIEKVIHFISERLPGSWGLLYERDDETTAPPGPNAFRVRTVARGRVEEHTDPFLSPCRPTIED